MQNFKFITHENNDAHFNLASEEYLLKQTDGFYVYLWINSPSVIVGINQNTAQEVNLNYTQNEGIKVVRRLTGGGAVYHDNGNLCYTVIAPYNAQENAYEKFTAPVIKYLNSIGVNAEFSGRNDITVDGKKISGNAQTVYGNRIMHHGTLLFSSDMEKLSLALNPSKLKVESKGIKSVRARVVNISDCLNQKITMSQFKKGLENEFLKTCERYTFSDIDVEKINALVKEKYSTYEWNIGRSPKGINKFEFKFPFGIFSLTFDLEKGLIQNATITGDFFEKQPVKSLSQKLNGKKFLKEQLKEVFASVSDFIVGADGEQIIDKIFND